MRIVQKSPRTEAALGERELDVMAALWEGGPGTVAEVRDRLPADLAYNTVLTILRNLESKKFVRHTAQGRTFRYAAAVSEQSVRGSALTRLVEKLFRGSPMGVVAHLVEHERLNADELRDLSRLVEERLSTTPHPRTQARSSASTLHTTNKTTRNRK